MGVRIHSPEVAKKRHQEQVYRTRMLDRRLAQMYRRRHPEEAEAVERKVKLRIAAERGPLPGGAG
jgi:hypothetical protein